MDPATYLKLCLDPVRLAVLGHAAEGAIDTAGIAASLGITERQVKDAKGRLRSTGVIDAEDRLNAATLRDLAERLPQAPVAGSTIVGPMWTPEETQVLGRFFSGERLREIPSPGAKRRLILERLVQEFSPGVRYAEVDVNFRLQLFHADYAALRRYLVDEGLVTRADGVYWRTGGRYELNEDPQGTDEAVDGRSPMLETRLAGVALEPWSPDHEAGLVAAANDPRVPRHMTDEFPHPYTSDAARRWLNKCFAEAPPLNFAIVVERAVAGGVGCEPRGDINTGTAELGWWLGPAWWGRGIATATLQRFVAYCFDELCLHRLEAGVFATNPASGRVAEKAGFELEAVQRDAYVKRGERIDRLAYANLLGRRPESS